VPYRKFYEGEYPHEADWNQYLMMQTVIQCTASTRPADPVEGMVIYESDTRAYLGWSGSAWGRLCLNAVRFPIAQTTEASTLDITSTTFAAGSPACSLTFTAPPSGAVLVTVSAQLTQSVATYETKLSYEIRLNDSVGAIHTAASNDKCITVGRAVVAGGAAVTGTSWGPMLITSLTGLATYYIRTMHRVTHASADGDVTYRHLLVQPVI
jgi:hypothetical protein